MNEKVRFVLFGGGHGMPFIAETLLRLFGDFIELTCVAVVSDSGGSGGWISVEQGWPSVGDSIRTICACVDQSKLDPAQGLLFGMLGHRHKAKMYRNPKTKALRIARLSRNSSGNYVMFYLQDVNKNIGEAIKDITNVLPMRDRVLPISVDKRRTEVGGPKEGPHEWIGHEAQYDAAKAGEKYYPPSHSKRQNLNPEVAEAMIRSHLMVLCSGSRHASRDAVVLTEGWPEAAGRAILGGSRLVSVNNLMNGNDSKGMTTADHTAEIVSHMGNVPLYASLSNTREVPENIRRKYAKEGESQVLWVPSNEVVRDITGPFVSWYKRKIQHNQLTVRTLLKVAIERPLLY